MTNKLPDKAKEWIDTADGFAVLVTLSSDGHPNSSVMWVTRDEDDLVFSTVAGRRKHHNLLADPRVSVVVFPISDPYSYVEVRGRAEIDTEASGQELISKLCLKYMGHGVDQPQDGRIAVRVKPDKVIFHPSRDLREELAGQDVAIHQC